MTIKPMIFIVDDNLADVMLIKEALKEHKVECVIFVANSGDAALEYVNSSISEPHPALVILDLNLPRISGLDILKRLRSDSEWNKTAIVIFSSSDDPTDKASAAQFGATMYLQKPSNLNGVLACGAMFKRIVEAPMSTAAITANM